MNALTRAQAAALAVMLVLVALLAGYAVTSLNGASPATAQAVAEKHEEKAVRIPLHNTLIITVHRKTGETETYVKEGDPWTQNLLALIVNNILGQGYKSGTIPITYTDGSTTIMIETEIYGSGSSTPSSAIAIGNGTTAFSPSDYRLASQIAVKDVEPTNVAFSDDGSTMRANITTAILANSNITVNEVGLILKAAKYHTGSKGNILIARDVLSSPISLSPGDTITITYQVSFTYDNPPFLKNFATLLFNYTLGLRSYPVNIGPITATDESTVRGVDFGYDRYDPYAVVVYDVISERLDVLFEGDAQSVYSPTKYRVESALATVSDVTLAAQVVNATHARIDLAGASYVFSSPVTIYGAGATLYTDINIGSGYAGKTILVLYFPLSEPLNVPQNRAAKLSFTIWLALAP